MDAGRVAVMPGLVNAHTHLELSHLRGQIPPATEFTAWVRQVIASRRSQPDATPKAIVDGIGSGIREVLNCGTAVVGDISNTLLTFGPLAMSPLAGVVFYELIRFNTTDPEDVVEQAQRAIDALPISLTVRANLAAHAPYSVAPGVFRAIDGEHGPRSRRSAAASISPSHEKRSNSFEAAPDRGAAFSKSSDPGIRRGWRPDAHRWNISTIAGFSTSGCLRCTACR